MGRGKGWSTVEWSGVEWSRLWTQRAEGLQVFVQPVKGRGPAVATIAAAAYFSTQTKSCKSKEEVNKKLFRLPSCPYKLEPDLFSFGVTGGATSRKKKSKEY